MGTRHLLEVTSKGKVKVAQYGQFDGYFQGVGQDLLKRMQNIVSSEDHFLSFIRKVDSCEFVDGSDVYVTDYNYTSWASYIVDIIDQSENGLELVDSSAFRNDTFCEFVYELNLDKKTITVIANRVWDDESEDGDDGDSFGDIFTPYSITSDVIKVYDLNNLTLSTSEPLTDK